MEIVEVDPTDARAVGRLVAVTNAARAVDSPWLHPMTEHECVGELTQGWDAEPALGLLAVVDGVDVGAARLETPSYDNRHLAWWELEVDPAHRRRGHGSALLANLVARSRAEGRTTLGSAGWAGDGPARFAARHGFKARMVEVHRRQYLHELDRAALDGLRAEASPHADEYELLRWPVRTPPDLLAEMAELTAAINDAPTDDLDIEDEVFTAERITAYERAWLVRGHRLHRVVARHRPTGRLVGQSVVAVDLERPELAEQHDTSVVDAHRGHRLGLLLKLEMLRWLAEEEPQVRELDTWNAESNDHMVGINEVLAYRVLGRAVDYQRTI